MTEDSANNNYLRCRSKLHVLVTGGAGYLGSVLVPLLLEKGHSVTVLDLFNFGVTSLLSNLSSRRLRLIKGDVRDEYTVKQAMKTVDAVMHLAAVVGYPACDKDPKLAEDVNVNGTRNIVKFLGPMQRLIYSSTGSCYGAVEGICKEDVPLSPVSLYGKTKAEAERLVLDGGGTCLRLATLFGVSPRMRLDLLVNDLTMTALTTKCLSLYEASFKRSFLHVRDAAWSFVFALNFYEDMKGQVFNVGDEKMNLTKEKLAEYIQMHIPNCKVSVATEGEDKDKRDYHVSYKKIRTMGFTASRNIMEGIEELINVLPKMSKSEIENSRNA